MALPWYIIRKLQMNLYKKTELGAIFGVVIVTIVFEILRTFKTIDQGALVDTALYTSLEINFAVIASCMPVYRALLRKREKDKRAKPVALGFTPAVRVSEQYLLEDPSSSQRGRAQRHTVFLTSFIGKPTELYNGITGRDGSEKNSDSHTQLQQTYALQEIPAVHLLEPNGYGVSANPLVYKSKTFMNRN